MTLSAQVRSLSNASADSESTVAVTLGLICCAILMCLLSIAFAYTSLRDRRKRLEVKLQHHKDVEKFVETQASLLKNPYHI
ncbi:hypothetical protein BCR33DRAFT_711259 [Rhizoclosmatium globosum]|uniref:Uncharacterized protein n=1 Tax=Rhizoclosmatium globosum TaxID=329046 RepID=A0A1Y2D3T2_9FUNG|nr:hypothetical protein BCR33DRAFT_711259 [Rhizoclosmatium globosum]|eukprot:ORY53920.1 hypothetical protein BCR33DRAFT_711259 [Rhizoclosmatium globosum]